MVSEQTAVFGSAPFQENGSNSNTRAGQKAGLFNHLEAQPATAAAGGTCHSGLPRTQGQMPALRERIPKLTPGPRDSQ